MSKIGEADEEQGEADVLIVTAMEDERDAMLNRLDDVRKLPKIGRHPFTYYEGRCSHRRFATQHRIIVAQLVEMGPTQAAVQTASAIVHWNPLAVVLVGIAGGIPGAIQLGDVVVPKEVFDYTLGKVELKGRGWLPEAVFPKKVRSARWTGYRADISLYDSALNLSGWEDRVSEERPANGGSAGPKLRKDAVGTGNNVIADSEVTSEYRKLFPKMCAVEMEAGGVASAIHSAADNPRFLMVKGISDMAGSGKAQEQSSGWRAYALDVATSFTRALLDEWPTHPLNGMQPTTADGDGGTSTGADLRSRDVRLLKEFWRTCPLDVLDHYFDRAASQSVPDSILYYYEGIAALSASSRFHVHDEELDAALGAFLTPFLDAFTFTDYFDPTPNGDEYRFMARHRHGNPAAWSEALSGFADSVEKAQLAFRALVELTQAKFPEIDLDETSTTARQERSDFYRDREAEMEAPSERDIAEATAAMLAMVRQVARMGGSSDREVVIALESPADVEAAQRLVAKGKGRLTEEGSLVVLVPT